MKPRKRRDCKKRDELMMKLQEGGQELRGGERERVCERKTQREEKHRGRGGGRIQNERERQKIESVKQSVAEAEMGSEPGGSLATSQHHR